MSDVSLRDLLVFEAAESGYKAELERLREFHAAATAPMMALYALHEPGCPHMGEFGKCTCGGLKREARLDRALTALKEAAEDMV